jgi:hypothetical protein
MLKRLCQIAAVAVLLLVVSPPLAQAEFVHLTLQSQSGDFIGGGGNFDLSYTPGGSGSFFVGIGPQFSGGTVPFNVSFILGVVTSDPNTNTFTTLFFSTFQLGTAIQPGTYTDAQRAAFANPGHPGLDVSFQNRGSNTLTGQFTINKLTYATKADGTFQLLTFDADFEQHSEGRTPALFGNIQYDINGTAVAPEPTSLTMFAIGAVGLLGCAWRRRRAKA